MTNTMTHGFVLNEVAAAFLYKGLESTLEGFFKFCGQRGQDEDELFELFQEFYYGCQRDVDPKDYKPEKKASPKKQPAKKPVKKTNAVEDLPQTVNGMTILKMANLETDSWCRKIPLSEFKKYSKERGLPVSGTKAQLISNLKKYEKSKEDALVANEEPEEAVEKETFTSSKDKLEEDVESENEDCVETKKPLISIKKPKRSGKKQKYARDKLAEPETRELEYKSGYWMVKVSEENLYLVMSSDKPDSLAIGYVENDDLDGDDKEVDVRPLTKKVIQMAQKLQLPYDIPDDLDA